MKLCGISKYMLLTLQDDLKANGLAGRLHGNLKRAPKLSSRAYIDLDYSVLVKNFIIQYGEIHGSLLHYTIKMMQKFLFIFLQKTNLQLSTMNL